MSGYLRARSSIAASGAAEASVDEGILKL